jgi:hypothetical protein
MPKSDFFTNPITQMATLAGNWLGPVPGHINPLQEINALVAAKDNALTTPADAAAQYGSGEYEDFIEEWQQQMEQFRKMSPEAQAAAMGTQEEKINSEDNDEDDKPVVQNRGKYNEMVTIQTPQGNFDIKMEKRLTKKTAKYTDMYGVEKTLEITEEEI